MYEIQACTKVALKFYLVFMLFYFHIAYEAVSLQYYLWAPASKVSSLNIK